MTDNIVRKILVATDGSDQSVEAATYASDLAKCMGAEATILYAFRAGGLTQFVAYSVESGQDLPGDHQEAGEVAIEKSKKPFLEKDLQVHSKIVEGYAPEVILQEAADGKYDLLVLGSRGAGSGLVRRVVFGLGSVAERVVANAPCPVLVVRH